MRPNGRVDTPGDDDATEPRPGARCKASIEMLGDSDQEVEAPALPPQRTKRLRSPSLASSDPEDVSTPSRPSSKGKKGKTTPARPNTSAPVNKTDQKQQKKKKKTGASSERLSGVVAEENSTQRELMELSKAKILADTRLKERKLELKAQRLLQRDKFAHERQLAQVHAAGYSHFQAPPYRPGSRAPSPPYAPSNPYGRSAQPAPYACSM
jgi:hypothetical protein